MIKKDNKKKVSILYSSIQSQAEIQKHLEKQLKPISNYTKAISNVMKPQVEMAKQINRIMKPQVEMAKQINRIMKPQVEMLQIISENIRVIEQSYLQSLKEWLPPIFDKRFLENLSKFAKEYNSEDFKKFEKEWGWALNKKSAKFGNYLFALYKEHGATRFKDRINKTFYHRKNTDLVLKNINEIFPERHHLIKDAFDLHLKRKYASSIALMLPQIEGIIWDLGMKKGIVRRGYNSEFLKGGRKKEKIGLSDLFQKIFKEDGFHNVVAKDIFMEGFRNKVLHGRNIYLKKEREISRWKSTLLILTLWRLYDEFNHRT